MDSDKKYRKKKGKDKKKKRRRSPSSSSSNDSDEWVEAPQVNLPTKKVVSTPNPMTGKVDKEKEDNGEEWISDKIFAGFTRDQLKPKKEKSDDTRSILDNLGQSDRELNPYWKDGGSGLPEHRLELKVTDSSAGDYGVEWLRKALRRSKEQAAEEGRSLEDVVAERWGSLHKLESMIKDAERKADEKKYEEHKDYRRKHDNYDIKPRSGKHRYDDDRHSSRRHYKDEDNYSHPKDRKYYKKDEFRSPQKDNYVNKGFRKPSDDDDRHLKDGKTKKKTFMKPVDDDDYHSPYKQNSFASLSSSSSVSNSGRGWKKQKKDEKKSESLDKEMADKKIKAEEIKKEESKQEVESKVETSIVPLTANERNELAAKLIKAEMMGNSNLVEKLKKQLEEARTSAANTEEVVVLTRTDSKGFTRPVSLPEKLDRGKKQKGKLETHEQGKRVRYFADDDRYSLQEMFEREKCSTVEDQNAVFARLASKNVGRDDSARDMEDVFDDMIRKKESDGKVAERERSKAIEEHRRTSKALDDCQWCLEGKKLLKHLVVAVGSKVYLCLPPYESLTEGHCLLLPSQHVSCATQLDEDVWEEMQNFRSALVSMFLSEDLDVVFFECAMHFYHVPHMVLHCVPLPKESGDVAPVYFKKAIMECETEWSTNKKLVDLAGKNVRRAVPRGLPYFSVDFGLQSGFAHVIEDEKEFPKNFAQEIIGGMLDVDHSLWRKPRIQKFEDQRKKVVEFIKMWKPYDFTKQIKNC